ncbi:hypothetical protein SARC_07118 [Sphaeroforma arctica JP610]|uniref:C2H2-type domain-containing protein n=1 Tax=Sphaeroforma arctica JP610 TaxID=667725 RepID=A0A0L0FUJ6_9EUKA|nr:hypothetical protein SARC_07118 [Sphaeroforma arctica JP610]KNC80525.1 hypothetical protein SARC_07118 [Sphaeroforma arctica JP610]|eukprot:XP_014154427.1 hypothetical protein SARC_07118 [Sphaeroforma arctica JP610]
MYHNWLSANMKHGTGYKSHSIVGILHLESSSSSGSDGGSSPQTNEKIGTRHESSADSNTFETTRQRGSNVDEPVIRRYATGIVTSNDAQTMTFSLGEGRAGDDFTDSNEYTDRAEASGGSNTNLTHARVPHPTFSSSDCEKQNPDRPGDNEHSILDTRYHGTEKSSYRNGSDGKDATTDGRANSDFVSSICEVPVLRGTSTEDRQSDTSENQIARCSDNSVVSARGNVDENATDENQSVYGGEGRCPNSEEVRIGRETSTDGGTTSSDSKDSQRTAVKRDTASARTDDDRCTVTSSANNDSDSKTRNVAEIGFDASTSGSPASGGATEFGESRNNRKSSSSQGSSNSECKTVTMGLSATGSTRSGGGSQSSSQSPDGETSASMRIRRTGRVSEGSTDEKSVSSATQGMDSGNFAAAGNRAEQIRSMTSTTVDGRQGHNSGTSNERLENFETAQSIDESKSSRGKNSRQRGKKSGVPKGPPRARAIRTGDVATQLDDAATTIISMQENMKLHTAPKTKRKPKAKGKTNRRSNSELKRSYMCEYERCGRKYASKHARHLHYRIKHNQDSIFNNLRGEPSGTQQPQQPQQPLQMSQTQGLIFAVPAGCTLTPQPGVIPMQGQPGIVKMEGQQSQPVLLQISAGGHTQTQTVNHQMMLVMLPDGTQQLVPLQQPQQNVQQVPIPQWQTNGHGKKDQNSISKKSPHQSVLRIGRPPPEEISANKCDRKPPRALGVKFSTTQASRQVAPGQPTFDSVGRDDAQSSSQNYQGTNTRRDIDRFHSPASRHNLGVSGSTKGRKTEMAMPSSHVHGGRRHEHHLDSFSGEIHGIVSGHSTAHNVQNGNMQQHESQQQQQQQGSQQHSGGCGMHPQGAPHMSGETFGHTHGQYRNRHSFPQTQNGTQESTRENFKSRAVSNSFDLTKLLGSNVDKDRLYKHPSEHVERANTIRTRSLGYFTQNRESKPQSLEFDRGRNTGNWIANDQTSGGQKLHMTQPIRGREHYTHRTQMQDSLQRYMLNQSGQALQGQGSQGQEGELYDDDIHARKRSHSHPRNRSPRFAQISNRKLSPQNQLPPPRHRQKGNGIQRPNTANEVYSPRQSCSHGNDAHSNNGGGSCAMHGHGGSGGGQYPEWNQNQMLNSSGNMLGNDSFVNGDGDVNAMANSTLDRNTYRYNNSWSNTKSTPSGDGTEGSNGYNSQSSLGSNAQKNFRNNISSYAQNNFCDNAQNSLSGNTQNNFSGNTNDGFVQHRYQQQHNYANGTQQSQSSSESGSGGGSGSSLECTMHGDSSEKTNMVGTFDGGSYRYNVDSFSKNNGMENQYANSSRYGTTPIAGSK